MTIEIKITLPSDADSFELERKMRVFGFVREDTLTGATYQALTDPENQPSQFGTVPAEYAAAAQATVAGTDAVTVTGGAPRRERGQPSPGKTRRTKAEIAEDDAVEAAEIGKRDGSSEGIEAAISTGGERIDPDSAEDVEQDAADEAAETAAASTGKLTHDDLRKAVGSYREQFGMPKAVKLVEAGGLIGKPIIQVEDDELPGVIEAVRNAIGSAAEEPVEKTEPAARPLTRDDVKALMTAYMEKYGAEAIAQDGPKVFKSALGDVPEGTKNAKGVVIDKWVLSAIPDDQDSLASCVKWWKSAISQASEAYGRKAV